MDQIHRHTHATSHRPPPSHRHPRRASDFLVARVLCCPCYSTPSLDRSKKLQVHSYDYTSFRRHHYRCHCSKTSPSSTSNAQQNVSLSNRTNPLPSGTQRISRVENSSAIPRHRQLCSQKQSRHAANLLAGTPTHSATSSASPLSPTHSSLHKYTLPSPVHTARLPFLTGFHFALITVLVWTKMLRSFGDGILLWLPEKDGEPDPGGGDEGKEYKNTIDGASSNLASSRLPFTLKVSCTAPDLGFAFVTSGRVSERLYGGCTRSSVSCHA